MTATATPRTDRLMTLMGARRGESEPGHTDYSQELGPRFHDHRGRTILGSIGVLVDAVPGGAAGRSVPAGTQTVLSQITATLAAPLPEHGLVRAHGQVAHLDLESGIGLSDGDVSGPDGRTFAVLASRSVVVTRGATHAESVFSGEPLPVPDPEPVSASAEIVERSGLDVVGALASGTVARGPLAGLLGVELRAAERGRVVGEFAPRDWMANYVGSIQGGILISAADLLTGLAAQSLTDPGQDYRALDLKIDFVRSPALDGGPIRVEADVVRAGRRLALVDTRTVDATGALLARTSASVQLL
ncbi:hotdog fold thioesterase [Rhodococcus sp. NPDC058514]|uniref:PaaI family thioesterase n=1 Tax=unclassified Rhodococcus (in: high G+C Gram-positive bacteria) TaxID=192944 RepID=UPI00365290B9